ncbi:hypothetical protein P343_07190 [Sporolactobacillus laevolacticus DSM 442]|uniref:Uncharacterized protein n=1 Tax=Sporolactobacillus laevolacticus DSM 442 TaxID=1395513 RepID=V6IYI0_9BACL|nr:hypothetical protein P343_07190 [Sporolactobacillus laevolacticus DSM 442]
MKERDTIIRAISNPSRIKAQFEKNNDLSKTTACNIFFLSL